MKGKVLVIGNIQKILIENLTSANFICEYKHEINHTNLKKIIENYVGLVVRTYEINKTLIDAGRQLKFIGRAGSGLDKIDVEYASSKNIKVINSPEGNADAVAEHAIGMILGLLHLIVKSDREMRRFIFRRKINTGYELGSKTVGIIGFGNTGSRLAKKLSGFNCKVLAYDKYLSGFSNNTVQESSLQSLYNEADIVSVHLQGNAETEQYICETFINQFKKPIYLINTSRGF